MILYATRKTIDRYRLKLPSEFNLSFDKIANSIITKENGNRLLEWGVKLFYFDKRKCLQVVNFASKLTLVLVDVKVSDIECIGNIMAQYLFELYKNDKKMTQAIKSMLKDSPISCFTNLTDKSTISTLNRTQTYFLDDKYFLYSYIENNIFQTVKLNHWINFEYLVGIKIDGKTEYIYPAEKFRECLLNKYII